MKLVSTGEVICDKCKMIVPRKKKYFTLNVFEHNNPFSKTDTVQISKSDLCKRCYSGMMNFISRNSLVDERN